MPSLWASYRPTTPQQAHGQYASHGASAAAAPPPSSFEGMTGESKGKGYGKGYTYIYEGKGRQAPSWYATQESSRRYLSGAGQQVDAAPDTGRSYGSTAYATSATTASSTPRAVLTAARRHPMPPPAPSHGAPEQRTVYVRDNLVVGAPQWQAEPEPAKGKGKYPFRPGLGKGKQTWPQAEPEPSKGNGKPSYSSGATKGGGGAAGATGFAAAWGGWGARGARMGADEIASEDDWFLTIFCIIMVLIGVGLASRPVRTRIARFLRWLAQLIDGEEVRAHVMIESRVYFLDTSVPAPADARALPERKETENPWSIPPTDTIF